MFIGTRQVIYPTPSPPSSAAFKKKSFCNYKQKNQNLKD